MERQLLTIFFIVISVVGCQQTPTNVKDIPNEISKNTSYDLVENKWRRNTHPYNLLENGSQYPYLYVGFPT